MKSRLDLLLDDIVDEQDAIDNTDRVLMSVRNKNQDSDSDYVAAPAIGTYLLNFYNGIENILKRICKEYFGTMPKGDSWHKELLILAMDHLRAKLKCLTDQLLRGWPLIEIFVIAS